MTSSVDADSDPVAWIASTLSISLDHAEHLLMLTHWVDHERVIERYGYPRDNVLPEPLSERFADPDYIQRLIAAEQEETPSEGVILEALERFASAGLRVEIEAEAVAGSGGADAVILAGGNSKRMGRKKSQIRMGCHTLLGHARAAVVDAGLKPRVIAVDLQPGLGPLGGILTALQSAKHSRVLFVGCDMPFLSGELIDTFLAGATGGVGPMFTQHEKGVGFPFVLSCADLALVEKQIDRGVLSLQRLAKRLKARMWQPPEEREWELFNINTPADLAEARRQQKGRRID